MSPFDIFNLIGKRKHPLYIFYVMQTFYDLHNNQISIFKYILIILSYFEIIFFVIYYMLINYTYLC